MKRKTKERMERRSRKRSSSAGSEKVERVGDSFISIQPLGGFSRNQSPVRRPVWLWHAASWASS